jgi:aquaporin Z
MKPSRICLLEFLATFGLVFFSAGAVCVNHMTTPTGQVPSHAPLTAQQPGLVGIALAYGLIVAAILCIVASQPGGYANPAITLMLWVFGKLETRRMATLVGVQLLASLAAAGLLWLSFDFPILREVRMGTPHLNDHAYPGLRGLTLVTGTAIELILTFFLVLAMFLTAREGAQPAVAAGAVVTVCVLVAYPLTGAALNPARWFGPCCVEAMLGGSARNPWVDTVVYVAGPMLGSLLAGLVRFKVFGESSPSAGR